MKTITLTFSFILLLSTLPAQEFRIDSIQTYDDSNTMIQRQHYAYDSNNVTESITLLIKAAPYIWNYTSRQVFVLDSNNRLMDYIFQYYGVTDWVNSSLQHFDYDSNGNNDTITAYNYVNDIPELVSRELKSYNLSNQMEENISQLYNGSTFDNYNKTNYLYGTGELAIDATTYLWDTSDWSADPFSRVLRDYTGTRIDEETHQTYSMGWVDDFRTNFTYDGDILDEFEQEEWDDIGGIWNKTSRGVYTYDGNGNIIEITTYSWSGSWMFQGEQKWYWSQIGLSTEKELKDTIKAFPNPTKNFVSISLEDPVEQDCQLKLYDIHGKLLSNTPFGKGAKHVLFSLEQFSSGLYMVKITNSNFEKTFKIIKE